MLRKVKRNYQLINYHLINSLVSAQPTFIKSNIANKENLSSKTPIPSLIAS